MSHLMDNFIQLAHVFGCLMKKDQWFACPFAIHPYIIKKEEYEHILAIQPTIQKLKFLLINDEYYLNELNALNDDFISNLLSCRKQKLYEFGIIRSDYIDNGTLKNVETNCIASSFSCLSNNITKIHQFCHQTVVPNNCVLPQALNEACRLYDERCTPSDLQVFKSLVSCSTAASGKCILMIIQPNESNISDQLGLQNGLEYPLFRITFDQVFDLKICDSTLIYLNYKVAVVYYRAGYTPNDYPTSKQLEARRILEHSNAINCPSISLQLMGLKKIQQLTSHKDVLLKHISTEEAKNLSGTFMGLFTMDQDTEQGKLAYSLLVANPDNFVLKPQREGGSNNYYGEKIIEHLSSISKQEYKKYILMEKIVSFHQPNTLIRYVNGNYTKIDGNCISEIGVYGYFISKNKEMLRNEVGGYLVRTKLVGTNEGGVATGYSYLNALQFEK
eukprot:NODE_410_length_9177_cov_0.515091.p2 type:complete len:445 gc:universal NODE_410_length_9177_cov_0.515091:3051-4385(+)